MAAWLVLGCVYLKLLVVFKTSELKLGMYNGTRIEMRGF
jgi:hypothetical protein